MLDTLPSTALVQMEVQPGRPDLNIARMRQFIDRAREASTEIVAFPELCISGYILGDLWEVDAVVEDFAAGSEEIRAYSESITVIFGNVCLDRSAIGEDGRTRKYNSVCVCSNGEYVDRPDLPPGLPPGTHPKTLHPNYRFFDDDRHFYSLRKLAQGSNRQIADWIVPFEIELRGGGQYRFGVQLCEDIWCQDYVADGEVLDTLRLYHARGAEAVFNLSSSPWTWQKNEKRNRVGLNILERSPIPFLYVNQVGAQNNGKNVIVFDGDTCIYDERGAVRRRAAPWREQVLMSFEAESPTPPTQEPAFQYHAIQSGLRHLDFVRGMESKYLIGVSGGIDSSLVVCLLSQALGADRVVAINMPTKFNSDLTQQNAQRVCGALGVEYVSCPIQELYEQVAYIVKATSFPSHAGDYSGLVDENIQARIRGADILCGLAAKLGMVFTNNGNKTELALGYATLYGDMNGAIAPMGDLYKVQIEQLARYLNENVFGREVIPNNLITGATVPSAELSEDQDVTRGLGDPIKYGYHDAVLRQLIEYRYHISDFFGWLVAGELFDRIGWFDREQFAHYFPNGEVWAEDLEWVERQMRINIFKRIQSPPIIVLSKRAFGFDLRESQLSAYRPRSYDVLRNQALDSEFWTQTSRKKIKRRLFRTDAS